MSDVIGEVGSYADLPTRADRREERTEKKPRDKAGDDKASQDEPLAMARQRVADALIADGFLGFNVARCDSLRRFVQTTQTSVASDVNETIDYVRAILSEHGYYGLTSSGQEKMDVFVEPDMPGLRGPMDVAIHAPMIQAAEETAKETGSQIQTQPETAEETQANVSSDAALKLLV